MKYINLKALLACVMAVALAGCGGKIEATIGGTVTGLSGGLTGTNALILQDNGGDNLTVTSNGSFTFPTQVEAGNTYFVSILNQPAGETCYLENQSGTVEQSIGNVESVTVICNVTASASNEVTGTVSGLTNGQSVSMTIGGTDNYTVNGNATGAPQIFSFPNPLNIGTYTASFASVTGTTCSFVVNNSKVSSATVIISANSSATQLTVSCP